MKLSRRVFLGTAVGGGLLLVLGGVTLGPMPVAGGLKALSRAEMETLRAVCETLFPSDVLGTGAQEAQVAEQVDAYVASLFGRERHLTRLMLRLLEQRGRLDGGAAFSSLPTETRASLLTRWELDGGVWGMGVRAIRALCAMMFFGDSRVQKTLGWSVGCVAGVTP